MHASCAHEHQSGQLRELANELTAWIVCDDCGETICYLPDQTADARSSVVSAATAEQRRAA